MLQRRLQRDVREFVAARFECWTSQGAPYGPSEGESEVDRGVEADAEALRLRILQIDLFSAGVGFFADAFHQGIVLLGRDAPP
jgi:hypothetical protein